MSKRKQAITMKYPSARVQGMSKLMEAMLTDDWNPPRIDVGLIETLAVAPSKEAEAHFTLRFLGLVDEEGTPTEELPLLRQSYQSALARLVRAKYATLFQQIPTKLMIQQSVVKFFMRAGYAEDTAEYQGMLFGWLCRQAGIEVSNLPVSFDRARFRKKNGKLQPTIST